MNVKELYNKCLAQVPEEISKEVDEQFNSIMKTILKEKMFKNITQELFETYKSKNNDYGDSFSKLFKKRGIMYSLDHFQEKINRIEALQSKKNLVKDESYIDSLKDLANYAILTLVEIEVENVLDS